MGPRAPRQDQHSAYAVFRQILPPTEMPLDTIVALMNNADTAANRRVDAHTEVVERQAASPARRPEEFSRCIRVSYSRLPAPSTPQLFFALFSSRRYSARQVLQPVTRPASKESLAQIRRGRGTSGAANAPSQHARVQQNVRLRMAKRRQQR